MIGMEHSAVSDYFRHCVYDAIAEYKTMLMRGQIEPNTVRFRKDKLLSPVERGAKRLNR